MVCYGLVLLESFDVPSHYVSPESQGLAILPSFGIGTITLSPLLLFISIGCTTVVPPLQIQKAFLPGLLSGLLWNISNLMSLMAIPIIRYSVTYPLLQSAILVSEPLGNIRLWGN